MILRLLVKPALRCAVVAVVLATPSVFGLQEAHALQTPAAGPRDNRVRTVVYDAGDVVKINGVIRASTQLVFSEDEEIAHVAIGDSVSWEVAPAGSILFLKPRERHPPTNLQVVTTRPDGRKRSYQFELSIHDTSLEASYFVVKFAYPEDEAERRRLEASVDRAARESGLVDEALRHHAAYGPRNWRYTAQGAASLEPESVYDDGKQTAFRFSGNREVPAIYIVNADGTESLVPKDIRGELVVAHAIGREFRLRRGAQVLCIFNEAFDPVGLNPRTGTAAPTVVRTTRIPPPPRRR
ncbi:MAG TPA: P-type conjugative transfer protein VirB9 [Microvirga sp.]|jgi:type IV secretion system protein VirB9|nr:P-type conjugative transfer protein VirB9 [Microvirga sp.]